MVRRVAMARKWWTLLAVCLAIFMLLLDVTIVNVALPAIQRDLGASFSQLEWVVNAYALTLAALLLVAGSLGDLFGRRLLFAAGLGFFTAASLLCGISPSATFLDVARGLQGIGASVMFATSLALIAQEFHGRERGTAFGIWGATTGLAVAIGPLVGGALTEGLGWEWIFYINLPIGLITFGLVLTRVAESRDPRGGRIDWPGVTTFSAALFALIFGLIRTNEDSWGSPLVAGMLVAAAVLMVLFIAIEARSEQPMLDLELFRKPAFAGVSIVAFVLSATMFSMILFLVLYLQNVLDYSPLEAGLRFLPFTLLGAIAAPIGGKLSAQLPARWFFGVGLAAVGTGLILMRGLTVTDEWTALLLGMVVAGAGMGIMNPPLASVALAVVEPAKSGMASGINSTFRQVGIATGIAGLGAIFRTSVESKAVDLLAGTRSLSTGDQHELANAIAAGGARSAIQAVPPSAREAAADAANVAFIAGLNDILLVAGVVAFVGAVVGVVLVRARDFARDPAALAET